MRVETLAVHAGRRIDDPTGALSPPIHLSSTFERDPDGSYPRGFIYGRYGNPNRSQLEEACCALEGGAVAAAFASGQAAATAVLRTLSPGDHVVAPQDAFYGTKHLLLRHLSQWGVQTSLVDMTDPRNVESALRQETRIVWVETPSNPMLKITDISSVVQVAGRSHARCVADNTWATPILQKPLELSADLVVHATTKYIGGHGDVTGGVVIARLEDEFFQAIRDIQMTEGAVPSPLDCWLVHRGIRTLPYRMRAHSENATRIARFLAGHSSVEAVHYPGLEDQPGSTLANQQMSASGGMLSFQIRGGKDDALTVAARVKLFTRAGSLGSPESLIIHHASVEGPESTTPQNLLRLSVGLEHADDLIEDLESALS